jgi:hypothetical protein
MAAMPSITGQNETRIQRSSSVSVLVWSTEVLQLGEEGVVQVLPITESQLDRMVTVMEVLARFASTLAITRGYVVVKSAPSVCQVGGGVGVAAAWPSPLLGGYTCRNGCSEPCAGSTMQCTEPDTALWQR